MNKLFIAFLVLLLYINSNAQSFTCPITPTLEYLYNTKSEISKISHTQDLELFTPALENWKPIYKLLKNKAGLFVLIDGTGQLYKATGINNKEITFNRIDSTRFMGYNFESINFSYKETIYSFGGYGIWNRSGQLTHFTPLAEWTIDKINKTYKTVNTFYSYQPAESKIYYIEFPWNEESTFDKLITTSVIEFDIKKRENKILGTINSKILFTYKNFSIDVPSLNGILNYNEGDIYLYKFSTNKVYKLTNLKIKDILIGKSDDGLQTTFEDSGKIFYSFKNDKTLRSLQISMNDFKEEDYPIYISETNYKYLWIVLLLLIISISILVIFKFTKRKKNVKQDTMEEYYIVDLNSNEFNSIENTLINKLIERSKIDAHLTVDELNSLLGIKKKTIEIQKRVRNEAINRINHKFIINFNIETTFIERTRSAEDRRFFNYIISKENAKVYLKNRPSN